jgi:RimJ/RimL family protein N-acetyltransferase
MNDSVAASDPSQPLPPSLEGITVRLRPVFPPDTALIYDLSMAPESAFRWRYRGEVVPLDAFVRDLWKDVLVQLIVESRRNGEPIGIVGAYSPDMRNGTVHLGVALKPTHTGHGAGIEAGGLFVNYLFKTWNFRKIYGYTPAWNIAQFANGGGRTFREEGRLVEHEYYDGRFWDLYIMALHRRDWEAAQDRRFRRRAARSEPDGGRRHSVDSEAVTVQ